LKAAGVVLVEAGRAERALPAAQPAAPRGRAQNRAQKSRAQAIYAAFHNVHSTSIAMSLSIAYWAVILLLLLPAALLLAAWAYLEVGVGKEPNAPPVWRGGLPFFGHFLRFAANPLAVIREGYAKHGPVFTLRFLHYSMTFLVGTAAHTPFFRAGALAAAAAAAAATGAGCGLPPIPNPCPPTPQATRSSPRTSHTSS